MFTALVLTRFDIALVGKEGNKGVAFPQLEDGKPCLGIMGPVSGDDVTVRVRQVKR